MYIPAQQYEDECEERRLLGARCEELEEEAEAAAAQQELAREEWQREMAAQRAAHELQLGQVCLRARGRVVRRTGGRLRAAGCAAACLLITPEPSSCPACISMPRSALCVAVCG